MNSAYSVSGPVDPSWPRGLMWVLIITFAASVALVSSFVFSRGLEKGENYVTLQVKAVAQTTGRDPCDILKEWLAEAK